MYKILIDTNSNLWLQENGNMEHVGEIPYVFDLLANIKDFTQLKIIYNFNYTLAENPSETLLRFENLTVQMLAALLLQLSNLKRPTVTRS